MSSFVTKHIIDHHTAKLSNLMDWFRHAEQHFKSKMKIRDKLVVKVFGRKWFNERRERPFEVGCSTGTAVQVRGSPTWYHLSHCVKAPTEEEIQIWEQKDEDSGGSREKTDRLETRKDVQAQDPEEEANDAANTYDASVHFPDDFSQKLPVDEERRWLSVIDLQHVSGTTEASPPEGDPTKTLWRHFEKDKIASCAKETKVRLQKEQAQALRGLELK